MAGEPTAYELPDERVRRAWERLIGEYLIIEPLEPALAERLLAAGVTSFAELGSSVGPISELLAPNGVDCVALDLTPPETYFRPLVQGDLRALPLRKSSFDAVSAINCLYFLGDPRVGVREASEILKPQGVFLAGAPSRYHDPELREVLPDWGKRSPFDAEDAADIVGSVFDDIEVEWWEEPCYYLPDHAAVVDYLVAFKVPDADARASSVPVPTHVTKSGVNIWARL